MQTERLKLVAEGPEHWRALREGEEAYEARFGIGLAPGLREFLGGGALSADFLAKLEAGTGPDPWTFGFAVVHGAKNFVMGMAGFKGPPTEEGMVEIAYGIVPDYQGQGHATAAAGMLIRFATENAELRSIRAHTLPERNASVRVLEKNGFVMTGAVEDAEDGTVWRWERGID